MRGFKILIEFKEKNMKFFICKNFMYARIKNDSSWLIFNIRETRLKLMIGNDIFSTTLFI